MYPLLLTPPCMDYLWGGEKLKKEYNIVSDKTPLAECWTLSVRDDYSSIVANGDYAGKTLKQVLGVWGDEAIGKNAAEFPYFPILIKLIDAKEQLSVQVHPNDDYAMRVEGEFGKTEMWYVVDCEPDAKLYYGFNQDLSKDEFKSKIENNELDSVCNVVRVNKGDVFFIPAGMLHSIGAGILVAEVQQNSNTTYRVYDFGRKDALGNTRELHIEKALDVTDLSKTDVDIKSVDSVSVEGGTVKNISKCRYFTTDILEVETKMNVFNQDSFVSLLCLDGECDIIYDDGSVHLYKGQSVYIPADFSCDIVGKSQIMKSYV